jgi:hypothetical protein
VGGVGLGEIPDCARGVVKIGTNGNKWAHVVGKAAGAGPEVENSLARLGVFQDFVHGTLLAVVGC